MWTHIFLVLEQFQELFTEFAIAAFTYLKLLCNELLLFNKSLKSTDPSKFHIKKLTDTMYNNKTTYFHSHIFEQLSYYRPHYTGIFSKGGQ